MLKELCWHVTWKPLMACICVLCDGAFGHFGVRAVLTEPGVPGLSCALES